MDEAIKSQGDTVLLPGTEFRPVSSLVPLLHLHPLWPRLKASLTHGVNVPLQETSTEEKLSDVREALQFGNHKGVLKYPDFFEECLEEDVRKGYSLVIPREKVVEIKDALVAPLNVHDQNTINE